MKQQFVETIKIKNGKALALPYHQARMERTIRRFFPSIASEEINLSSLISPKEEMNFYKARVVYGAQGVEAIEYAPYKMKEIHSLKVVEDDSIDYTYKSTDRSALNALVAQKGDCDEIIIVKNGLITDTSFTNLALFDGKKWLTPKHPLLQGTKRAQLLETGIIEEADLTPEDLKKAEKVSLFNAMIDFGEREVEIQRILQLYHLQIIRNEDSTLEVLGSFTSIIFFTISECFLLRMIQDKILHAQFLRQFSGIKRRTVAFLIRLERIAVGIETKRLTHHPVSPHYVASVLLVIRFITQARQDQRLIRFIRRRQLCSESELFFLSRLNIKAFQLHIPHFEAIAIFQLMEHHPFSHLSQLLLGKNHVDDGLDYLHHLIVSIHMQQSLVPLALCHHSDYPDYPQHMVGMRMGNEEVMNIRNLNIHLLQLRQYSVSSARIHQH